MTKQLKLFPSNSPYYALIKELLTACEAGGVVTVSFGSIRDKAKSPQARVRHEKVLIDDDSAQTFRGILAANLAELVERLEDGHVVREYIGAGVLAEDEFEHLDLSLEERIAAQIKPLATPLALEWFANRQDFMAGLRYCVISVEPASGPVIHGFSFFSEVYELQRSRWVTLLSWRDDGYYREVHRPGFLFDRQIDCLCAGSDMFIVNKTKFQQIFRFYEYVQQDASKAVHALHARVPLANIGDVITAAKRDSRMAIRLADLPKQPHFKRLSMPRVKRQIARQGLPVQTAVRDGVEGLVYCHAYKAEFLHLLCDDYVSSHMTYLDYESSAKRALKARRRARGTRASLRVVR